MHKSLNYLMAEAIMIFWSLRSQFTREDPNHNWRSESWMQFWGSTTERNKTTTQSQWFRKLVRKPHYTDKFCFSSILFTWADDGGRERTAIRQPIASWRTTCDGWKRQQEHPNITSKHLNIAKKKPLWGFIKWIKGWSS